MKHLAKSSRGVFNLCGWSVALLGSAVYLLTLEPTVSFWDCGEFIATSHTLQVGHPPGAPLYTLLAHLFTLLAMGNAGHVAWWSNALSAVAGGFTAMFLFWSLARILSNLNYSSSSLSLDSENGNEVKSYGSEKGDSRLLRTVLPALVGTACYLFCDTAWFSAVESEVYSLSMLFSSAIVWVMLRWAGIGEKLFCQTEDKGCRDRWLYLVAFLLGLSASVHLLSLLAIPAVAVLWFAYRKKVSDVKLKDEVSGPRYLRSARRVVTMFLLFAIGLSPYLLIPNGATAAPPINMGDPSTASSFRDYVTRKQYEHAPLIYGRCYNSPIVNYDEDGPIYAKEMDMLFPRMWKSGPHSDQFYNDWCGRLGKIVNVDGRDYYKPSFGDNLIFFGGYQVGYMYLRYLMWNFAGRYDDRQGFGNLQKGQFITGLPFIDRLYVGTAKPMPPSLPSAGHNRYFLLPFLLGLVGLFASRRDKVLFWTLLTLFLTSSLLLSVYLNHPMYEPRERDYAYILSFYTFAVWIGLGADRVRQWLASLDAKRNRPSSKPCLRHLAALLLAVPLLMACQNWDDHDRGGRFVARDVAANMLNSCGAKSLLFTVGDNDTFPLWYLQQVEKIRTDVQIVNISLLGSDPYCSSVARQLVASGIITADEREAIFDDSFYRMGPWRRMMRINSMVDDEIFYSHYAANDGRSGFGDRLDLCGYVFRMADSATVDSVDADRSYRLMTTELSWHSLKDVYIDEECHTFLCRYWRDVVEVSNNLANMGRGDDGVHLLDVTMRSIPLECLSDVVLVYEVSEAYAACGHHPKALSLVADCRKNLSGQIEYFGSMSPSMRQYIQYTLDPLRQLAARLDIPCDL